MLGPQIISRQVSLGLAASCTEVVPEKQRKFVRDREVASGELFDRVKRDPVISRDAQTLAPR